MLYVEGVGIVAANVAYGEATPYLTVTAGSYNVQLRPAGADSAAPQGRRFFAAGADGNPVTAP